MLLNLAFEIKMLTVCKKVDHLKKVNVMYFNKITKNFYGSFSQCELIVFFFTKLKYHIVYLRSMENFKKVRQIINYSFIKISLYYTNLVTVFDFYYT